MTQQQPAAPPLVLDLDASVGRLPGELRLNWAALQETLRFSATLRSMRRLRSELQTQLPAPDRHGPVFLGSGDFHHLSWPLIERHADWQAQRGGPPLRVLIFDNHPDNMRFPFGVHCGSWVRRVAALAGVARVEVVGITSRDIGAGRAWENQLGPLRAGKLRYWSAGVDTGWARWLGLAHAFRSFDDLHALVEALCGDLQAAPQPTYVSIDKDVLSSHVVQTNWDQGGLEAAQLETVLTLLQRQVVGSDVTGEISSYRYRSRFKRLLSYVDAQPGALQPAMLAVWQAGQHALNLELLGQLQAAQEVTTP